MEEIPSTTYTNPGQRPAADGLEMLPGSYRTEMTFLSTIVKFVSFVLNVSWNRNCELIRLFILTWRPRDILTLRETESRLSLGMTSNKTYHFQTTANHHRFIKVWTSIADLPTSIFFVQTFFFVVKSMAQKYPTYL